MSYGHCVLIRNRRVDSTPSLWSRFKGMANGETIQPDQVLETLGELVASISNFAAKGQVKSFESLPGDVRPTLEAVESFEEIVYRFRDQAGQTYKPLPPLLIESLEAYEAGKVFNAVPPLLQCVEKLVDLHNQDTITFTPDQQQRMRDYHRRLEKLVPEATQSEIDLPL